MISNLVYNSKNKLKNSIFYSSTSLFLSIPINLYLIDKLLPRPLTHYDFNYYKLKMQLFFTNCLIAACIGFIYGVNKKKHNQIIY